MVKCGSLWATHRGSKVRETTVATTLVLLPLLCTSTLRVTAGSAALNFPTHQSWGAAHSYQGKLYAISGAHGTSGKENITFDPRCFVLEE